MAEYYVERQCWQHWPKTLIMCRRTGRMDNGNVAVQRRRYVPDKMMAERDTLIRDCLKLLGTWDRAEWDNTSDIYTAGMEYEPEGNYAVLIERARKMGVEL